MTEYVYLFTVSRVFVFKDRGVVLDPGVPLRPGAPQVRAGALVELRRPNGTMLTSPVAGLELFVDPPPEVREQPSCLISAPMLLRLSGDEVPIGTKVRLLGGVTHDP